MTFFITGASSGIGHALSLKLLADGHIVYGISRTNSIEHPSFTHIQADLSKESSLMNFKFPTAAGSVCLINNAGSVGPSGYVGELDNQKIYDTVVLNTMAPMILSNHFIKVFNNNEVRRIILNISSGAAVNAYDGWSIYCSTKSAINMLSLAIKAEQSIRNSSFEVYAVAPGIVDTPMQDCIRTNQQDDFSLIDKFLSYKDDGMLKDPNDIARMLSELIDSRGIDQTIYALRDYPDYG